HCRSTEFRCSFPKVAATGETHPHSRPYHLHQFSAGATIGEAAPSADQAATSVAKQNSGPSDCKFDCRSDLIADLISEHQAENPSDCRSRSQADQPCPDSSPFGHTQQHRSANFQQSDHNSV
ncbi:hypothetical protein ACLOJK_024332, partial [Asimina triloba]